MYVYTEKGTCMFVQGHPVKKRERQRERESKVRSLAVHCVVLSDSVECGGASAELELR